MRVLGVALAGLALGAAAPLADQQLPDAMQEQAARGLMDEIRCLVCAGQSVADSDADMAGDMRSLIRERVAAGEPPEAIRTWLVDRYGPAISYRPPASAVAWPLWAAPLVLLGLAVLIARPVVRRRRRRP